MITDEKMKKWAKVRRAFTDTSQDNKRCKNNATKKTNKAAFEKNEGESNRKVSKTDEDYLDITF